MAHPTFFVYGLYDSDDWPIIRVSKPPRTAEEKKAYFRAYYAAHKEKWVARRTRLKECLDGA